MEANPFELHKIISVKETEVKNLLLFYNLKEDIEGIHFSNDFKEFIVKAATWRSDFCGIDRESSIFVLVNKEKMFIKDVLRLSLQARFDLCSIYGTLEIKKILSSIACFVAEQPKGIPGHLDNNGTRNYIGFSRSTDGQEYMAFVFWDKKQNVWHFDALDIQKHTIDPGLWFIFNYAVSAKDCESYLKSSL
jgi:hypothetical protein